MIKQPTIPTMPKRPKRKEVGMDKEWITIVFQNGDVAHYKPEEYTDYHYDKICFIVIRDKQWIGIYNIDEIKYVEVIQE